MIETTNNPKFVAGFVVRTSRRKPAMGSNDYRYCRFNGFHSSPDERNLFQFFIIIEFDTTHLAEFLQQLQLLHQNQQSTGVIGTLIKVRVWNSGRATDNIVRAKLRVLEGSSQERLNYTKRLIWNDSANTVNIYPKDEGQF